MKMILVIYVTLFGMAVAVSERRERAGESLVVSNAIVKFKVWPLTFKIHSPKLTLAPRL